MCSQGNTILCSLQAAEGATASRVLKDQKYLIYGRCASATLRKVSIDAPRWWNDLVRVYVRRGAGCILT